MEGGSQAQDHRQAIYAKIRYSVSSTFATGCSSTGFGFTLAQIQNGKEVVIAYNGRGLNRAEQNYSTTEREALALVEGI